MIALYILLGILGLILLLVLLLLFVPVLVRIRYDRKLNVRVRILGIPVDPLRISRAGKKPASEKKISGSKKKKPGTRSRLRALRKELSGSFAEDGPGATVRYLAAVADMSKRAARSGLRAVTVTLFRLEMRVGGEDPATTAVRYGRICSVLYPALTTLLGNVRVQEDHVRVEPDFLADKSAVFADVRLRIGTWRLPFALLTLVNEFSRLNKGSNTK